MYQTSENAENNFRKIFSGNQTDPDIKIHRCRKPEAREVGKPYAFTLIRFERGVIVNNNYRLII